MGRGQAREQSGEGFQEIFGRRRGRPGDEEADDSRTLSHLLPDLDFRAVSSEAFARQEGVVRECLHLLGARSQWADHLWHDPREGHKVHLRTSRLSDCALCQPWTDEYGSNHGDAKSMVRVRRGAWAETQRLTGDWKHCPTCESRIRDMDEEEARPLRVEMEEALDYPPLAPDRTEAFATALEEGLREARTTNRSPSEPEVAALADEALVQALTEECLETTSEATYREILPDYQTLWMSMPRSGEGRYGHIPMRIEQFVPRERLRPIYEEALREALARGEIDKDCSPTLAERTAKRVRNLIRREIARRELDALGEDD
jgi:hypothetical protein